MTAIHRPFWHWIMIIILSMGTGIKGSGVVQVTIDDGQMELAGYGR